MQIKFSLDKTSLKKIGKGALIAVGSTLVAYAANNVDAIREAFKDSPILASLVTAFAGIAINIAKEWIAGEKRKTLEGHEDAVDQKVLDIVSDVKEEAKDQVIEDIKNNS